MQFFIHSGTDIRPLAERYDSATLALDAASDYLKRRLPNVSIVDQDGDSLTLAQLRELASEENENEDA
jgi:hypothetical protein